MGREPQHLEISRHLRESIISGKHGPGSRLPSEAQLVKQFGVSRPTVARAFRDLQDQGYVERRAGSGTYVRSGRIDPVASTRQLGLLIPGLGSTEIFELICGELASLARAAEYTLLWGSSPQPRLDQDGSRDHAEELCEQFIERRVTGVFFAPFELTSGKDETNTRIAEHFREAGIPVVLLDRDLAVFPNRSDFDLVGLDNVAAGYVLAEHLLKLGCRHILFAARPRSAPTVDARMVGVREALLRWNIDPEPGWVCIGDPADAKYVRGLTAGGRADAIICANDLTAAQLMRSLDGIGMRVPRDVRLAGFDDAKYATLLSVPLTTIHQPIRDIALVAFRAMLDRVDQPTLPARSFALTPRLVVRESCGAYLAGNKGNRRG